MNNQQRAAMQQALEALEYETSSHKCYNRKPLLSSLEAITALLEALAEQVTVSGGLCGGCAKKAADGWALYCVECWEKAEQEPVAFRFPRDTESWTGGWTIDYKVIRSVDAEIEDNEFKPCLESVEQVLLALEKVYAAQQPVQDIMEAVDAAMAEMQNINPPLRRSECERLIRAANYAAPVQEPVAVVDEIGLCLDGRPIFNAVGKVKVGQKLYAAPVQQVDLTDGEIVKTAKWTGVFETKIGYEFGHGDLLDFARAVIAAYKEKNK